MKILEIFLRILYRRMLVIDEEVRPLADLIVEAVTPQIVGWYPVRLKIWSLISSENENDIQEGYGYLAGIMSITMGLGIDDGLALIDKKIKEGIEAKNLSEINNSSIHKED